MCQHIRKRETDLCFMKPETWGWGNLSSEPGYTPQGGRGPDADVGRIAKDRTEDVPARENPVGRGFLDAIIEENKAGRSKHALGGVTDRGQEREIRPRNLWGGGGRVEGWDR